MPTVALKSKEGVWVMVSTILASAMAFIDATALNVVLPSMQEELQASVTDIFWVLNAYLLMLASLILIGGSLGDMLGRKKIFMTGIVLFTLSSASCGMSVTIFQLIVFRIFQGIGGALMIPGSLSLISSSIHERERGKAIGIWSAVSTAVTIGGPILGGALADAGWWRYIFYINVPIGLIALFILFAKVKEVKGDGADTPIDVAGAVMIALCLASLTYGFLRIPKVGFNHWQVYISLGVGILLLPVFIAREKRVLHPMMPLHLFKNKIFSGTNLYTFFLYAGLSAGMFFLSLNLIQIQGYRQFEAGLAFLPFTLLLTLLSAVAGKLSDRYGPKFFLVAGATITGAALLFLAFIPKTSGPTQYWSTFFPGILIFGAGMTFVVAPLTATVMGCVSDQYSGVASGVNNAVTRTSGVFANAVFGALAVLVFSSALQKDLAKTSFDEESKREIAAQVVNLGNAKAPSHLPDADRHQIQELYQQGFLDAYRTIMILAAALCFGATLMAVLFVEKGVHAREREDKLF